MKENAFSDSFALLATFCFAILYHPVQSPALFRVGFGNPSSAAVWYYSVEEIVLIRNPILIESGEHRESFFSEQGQFKDNRPFFGSFRQMKEKIGKDLSY